MVGAIQTLTQSVSTRLIRNRGRLALLVAMGPVLALPPSHMREAVLVLSGLAVLSAVLLAAKIWCAATRPAFPAPPLTIVVLLLCHAMGCARQEGGLAGEWKGVGTDGQRLVLILKPDHDFRMVTGNEAVDASMYPNTQYRWTADTTHTPNRLTLTTTTGDQHMTIRVIYSLLDRNTLAIRFGVTPRGEPVDWEKMKWDATGPGSKQLVLERNPRIE